MTATTPPAVVHGTQMAYSGGCRCPQCSTAHSRRCKSYRLRSVRLGGQTTVDAAAAREVLASAAARMSLSAIGRRVGTSHSWVRRVIDGDIRRISTTRAATVARVFPGYQPTDASLVSAVGSRRRLQALHAIGYSWATLSRETGYGLTPLKKLAHGHHALLAGRNAERIRVAYERLAMTTPTGATRHDRAAITRAVLNAQRHGWPKPLAWDNIDDPDEQPTDWAFTGIDRAAVLTDVLEQGGNTFDACRVLGINREALHKWCTNHGHGDVFRALAAREVTQVNQYSDDRVAS